MSTQPSDGDASLLSIDEILSKRSRSKEFMQTAPTKKNADYYNMKHERRGKAIIFNHDLFTNNKLQRRTESKIDCQNLSKILKTLGFDIKVYDNLNYKEMVKTLEKAAKEDHSDADCLLIAVLTYGNLDLLHARDKCYRSEIIWTSFYADKCPSLAGKPKLIIIQGCQNDFSNKVFLQERTVTDDGHQRDNKEFCIPTRADFLIFFSSNSLNMKVERREEKKLLANTSCTENVTDGNTLPGCYQVDTPSDEEMTIDDEKMLIDEVEDVSSDLSSSSSTNGSLFIRSLCRQLRENGTIYDINTLLTYTIQLVVSDSENKNREMKESYQQLESPPPQIPYFVTMLTRLLRFNTKIKRSLPK